MSGYSAISLKKQQKSKYNLCKHQFRGNLKIKNQSISPKRLVGIESNISHHDLLNFLDYKPLSELLKIFFCITLERRWRVLCTMTCKLSFMKKRTTKTWLNLSLKSSIILNFMRLDMSFQTCNQEDYSCKYA